MKFKTLTGSTRSVSNIKKHLIDWDKESRSKFQFKVKLLEMLYFVFFVKKLKWVRWRRFVRDHDSYSNSPS